MKPDTETLLRATLRLDDSVAPDVVERALKVLRGEAPAPQSPNPLILKYIKPIMLRHEVADLCRVSCQTVSNWASHKRLDTLKDDRGQTIGYTGDSVYAVILNER